MFFTFVGGLWTPVVVPFRPRKCRLFPRAYSRAWFRSDVVGNAVFKELPTIQKTLSWVQSSRRVNAFSFMAGVHSNTKTTILVGCRFLMTCIWGSGLRAYTNDCLGSQWPKRALHCLLDAFRALLFTSNHVAHKHPDLSKPLDYGIFFKSCRGSNYGLRHLPELRGSERFGQVACPEVASATHPCEARRPGAVRRLFVEAEPAAGQLP